MKFVFMLIFFRKDERGCSALNRFLWWAKVFCLFLLFHYSSGEDLIQDVMHIFSLGFLTRIYLFFTAFYFNMDKKTPNIFNDNTRLCSDKHALLCDSMKKERL